MQFKNGDQVIVTNESLQSYGLIGTVAWCKDYYTSVLVKFEDWHGKGKRELYIGRKNLSRDLNENLNKENSTMAVKGNYNIAWVKFVQGTNTTKEYAFALFDTDVQVDDLVLCDTANGYSVAKVIRIDSKDDYTTPTVTKEIVCKVDFTAFERRKELRKQKEILKKQMDKMVHDNQELILYQAIADKNPEMAEMLAAYKALSDV